MSPTTGASVFWVFSPRTERATMWSYDQTKDFIDCAFRHLRGCILLENWHPGAHGITTVGKLHCIFCSETGALWRYLEMPKNNVSELVSITHLLGQTSLEFGNCKIWSCLWMSHANSNQKRHMAHLEPLDLYPQCPYNQNHRGITAENGGTNTTIICVSECLAQVSDAKCSPFAAKSISVDQTVSFIVGTGVFAGTALCMMSGSLFKKVLKSRFVKIMAIGFSRVSFVLPLNANSRTNSSKASSALVSSQSCKFMLNPLTRHRTKAVTCGHLHINNVTDMWSFQRLDTEVGERAHSEGCSSSFGSSQFHESVPDLRKIRQGGYSKCCYSSQAFPGCQDF